MEAGGVASTFSSLFISIHSECFVWHRIIKPETKYTNYIYKWCERTSGWAYAQKSNCNPNSKKQQTSAGSRWYDGFICICICICLYICIYICICICVVAGVQCASQPRFVRASFVRERKEGAPLSSRSSCHTFILDIQQSSAHLESFNLDITSYNLNSISGESVLSVSPSAAVLKPIGK